MSALAVAALLAACGGTSGGSASTPVSPSASQPAVAACDVISGSGSAMLGILNGTACNAAQSSVVLINLLDKDGQPSASCSGTVIAPRAVLTAAHCLLGDTASVKVWPGVGVPIPAASFQANPAYHGSSSSDPSADVGIIITTEDVNRTAIPLLASRDARAGEQAVIGGWGKDQNGFGEVLRAGTTTIASVNGAVLLGDYGGTLSSVCSGDSGGPLLLQQNGAWAIAGVTSASSVPVGACAAGSSYFAAIRDPNTSSFIFGLVPNAGRK